MDKLLTKSDVCDALSVSVSTLNRIMAENRLPIYMIRGSVRFKEADVQAYIDGSLAAAAKPQRMEPVPLQKRSAKHSPAVCTYVPGMKVV